MKRFLLPVMCVLFASSCGAQVVERNNTGNRLLESGALQDARLAFFAAQVAESDRPEPYYNAASASIELSELDQAQAELEQALKTADGILIEGIYYNLGNVFFLKEEYLMAINAYQQALLIDPSADDARYNLELALLQINTPTPTPVPESTETISTPTETPEPDSSAQNSESTAEASPTPESNQQLPSLSLEDALRLLDAVQESQETLPGRQATANPGSGAKDW